jgi:hypothetical protein
MRIRPVGEINYVFAGGSIEQAAVSKGQIFRIRPSLCLLRPQQQPFHLPASTETGTKQNKLLRYSTCSIDVTVILWDLRMNGS